jgi:DedD protein
MLESRVKERLTGAVILVALIVLLVPELLSGPGVTARPTRATDKDGAPMRSYTIDLAENGGAPRSAPTESSGTAELQPMPAQDDSAESDAGEAAQVQPDASAVARSEDEQPQPVAPEPVPQPAPVAPTPAVVAAEQPQPAPRSSPAPRSGAATSPVTGWMVQVGSFASRDNAARLARDLKSAGFAASMSESRAGGKSLYRVRVGPEAERAAAQAVVTRLRGRGITGAAIVPHP